MAVLPNSAPDGPRVSVIIRTRDEADRLRLTLASLASQTLACEIVVNNDGSTDHTADVIAEAASALPITVLTHAGSRGRSAASNAAAYAATGDILLFLDGDTLAGPDCVVTHARLHRSGQDLIARGETWNLRSTRPLLDPEAFKPFPGFEERVQKATAAERAAMQITRNQIKHDFAAIARRAQPGVYPGFGPRRLQELEMDALRNHPDCPVLWSAVSGSNLSVRRDRFLAAGGFLEEIDINAHRELGLRMVKRGSRVVPADGAHTFHMIHRSGWRDPLQLTDWQEVFFRHHDDAAARLLLPFWAGLSDSGLPTIQSLPDLARQAADLEAKARSTGAA